MRLFARLVLALALLVAAIVPSAAAYKVTDLLAGKTRPDFPGEAFAIAYTPVIDGGKVVFVSARGFTADALWSLDVATGKLKKLAGLNNKAPGTSARFTCFCLAFAVDDASPRSRFGTVAFFAMDADGRSGLYTVPLTGGTLRRVASTTVVSPDGTRYARFGLGVALTPTSVFFYAETAAPHRGIHTAAPDGANRRIVIDDRTRLNARTPNGSSPDYYGAYSRFVADRSRVFWLATGLFDPVSGPNAVFVIGRKIVVDNMTRLPGGGGGHTRLGAFSAPPGTAPIAFLADEPSTGYAGVFRAAAGATATLVTNTRRTAPGIGKPFDVFNRLCAGDDAVAFSAVADNRTGIFITPTGGNTTVVALQGTKYYKLILGEGCLAGRRVVFREDGGANRLLLGSP